MIYGGILRLVLRGVFLMLTLAGSVPTAIDAFTGVQARAEIIRIDAEPRKAGPLYVRVGNEEKRIADAAVRAWPIEDGRYVVYSGMDGAGGYENEGQSLRFYETATGSTMKVLSEYYTVDRVTGVRTTANKLALIVEMRDNGLGASHLAVVDPLRGETFFKAKVKLIERISDRIRLGHFKDKDWAQSNSGANIVPYKTEYFDLNKLLKKSVINNKKKPR